MKRQFSRRETTLLLILALIVLGCMYYILVDKPVRTKTEEALIRYDEAQLAIEIDMVKLEQLHMMREALADLANSTDAEVPDFNNSENVLRLLNEAMSYTTTFNMTFQPLVMDGQIVYRTIDIQYKSPSYASAARVLGILSDGPYRCEIAKFDMLGSGGSGAASLELGEVSVSLSITFYEFSAVEY